RCTAAGRLRAAQLVVEVHRPRWPDLVVPDLVRLRDGRLARHLPRGPGTGVLPLPGTRLVPAAALAGSTGALAAPADHVRRRAFWPSSWPLVWRSWLKAWVAVGKY